MKDKLQLQIEYSKLLGEFTGTLKGILWYDIDDKLRILLEDKIKELESKDLNFEEDLSSLGVLTGKDAERFVENMKIAENNRLPDEERKRIEDNYQAIMKIAKL